MVSSNESATRPRAADGEMSKNREPARATVTMVSPAAARAWATAKRANGVAERVIPAGAGGRSGRHPASSATSASYGHDSLKAGVPGADNSLMADLSKVLGDVYGSGDAAATRQAAAPEWADDSRLDEAFANWNPGPGPDAHATERELFVGSSLPLDDDLAAALSEALADAPVSPREPELAVRPSQTATWLADVVRPVVAPVEDEVPAPLPEPTEPTEDPSFSPPAPVALRSWQRVDDDVLARASGRGLRISLRRR